MRIDDTAFPDELRRRLVDADPARALSDHPEPWRLRESIIMSDPSILEPNNIPADQEPSRRLVPFPLSLIPRPLMPLLLAGTLTALMVLIGQSTTPDLPAIRISGAGMVNTADAAAPAREGASMVYGDKMIAPGWMQELRFDGSALGDLPTSAPVYRLDADLPRAELDAFAEQFGLGALADIDPAVAGVPGGLFAGSADWTGSRLEVFPSGSWYFSAYRDLMTVYDPCAPVPQALAESAVLERATAFLSSVGAPTDGLKVEYVDGFGSWVSAPIMAAGRPSGLTTSVGLSGDGEVTSASGFFGEFVKVGDYPLVGLNAALERLGSGGFMAYAYRSADEPAPAQGGSSTSSTSSTDSTGTSGAGAASEPAPAPADADQAAADPAVSPVVDPWSCAQITGSSIPGEAGSAAAPSEPGAELPVDVLPPDVVVDDAQVLPEPMPVETMPVEPEIVDVVLVSVEVAYTPLGDVDGVVWLVPQFVFTDTAGSLWHAMALEDRFLDEVQPPMLVEPAPIDPMPAEPIPDTPVADNGQPGAPVGDLVGMDEAEAVKLAESWGLTVRVVGRDGEMFPVTQDYRLDRVNLVIDGGAVSSAEIG